MDVVCIFVNDIVDVEVIRIMVVNGVKLFVFCCVGYNNVDLKVVVDNGVIVVCVFVYFLYVVVEYIVVLMFLFNWKILWVLWCIWDGNFLLYGLLGFDMYGKIVGIIGMGKIVKILIYILKGFGMNILVYDFYLDYNFVREN